MFKISKIIYVHLFARQGQFQPFGLALINSCIKFETHSKCLWFENNFRTQVCSNSPSWLKTFNLMSLYNFQIIKHMTELPTTSSLIWRVNRDSLAKRYFQVVLGSSENVENVYRNYIYIYRYQLQCNRKTPRMLPYYTRWEIKI